jgi:hypothetical protein
MPCPGRTVYIRSRHMDTLEMHRPRLLDMWLSTRHSTRILLLGREDRAGNKKASPEREARMNPGPRSAAGTSTLLLSKHGRHNRFRSYPMSTPHLGKRPLEGVDRRILFTIGRTRGIVKPVRAGADSACSRRLRAVYGLGLTGSIRPKGRVEAAGLPSPRFPGPSSPTRWP